MMSLVIEKPPKILALNCSVSTDTVSLKYRIEEALCQDNHDLRGLYDGLISALEEYLISVIAVVIT